jgi:hypothetical protein
MLRSRDVLLSVPGQQRQIQNQCNPVSIDEEKEGQECVDSGFGDNVGVQAVAKIDGVDVVAGAKLACVDQDAGCVAKEAMPRQQSFGAHSPFQIAIHDSKEDL